MPTKQRLQGTVVEISQKLEKLGYEDFEVIEPGEESESNSEAVYYIFVEAAIGNFYIVLSTEQMYGRIVYPYDIGRHIGEALEKEEAKELAKETGKIDTVENVDDSDLRSLAGIKVINQTPIDGLWRGKFNISAHGSTSLVSYREELTENGFVNRFKSVKGFLPFEDDFSLRTLDDRIDAVLIAGNRGRRYVESSLYIVDKGEPEEYIIKFQF